MKIYSYIAAVVLTILTGTVLHGCSVSLPSDAQSVSMPAPIWPDYAGVTIPPNIAPLNFRLETDDPCRVQFTASGVCYVLRGDGSVDIPARKWETLLQHAGENGIEITVYRHTSAGWIKHPPFTFHVAPDSIDTHLVYRLIEPTYANWNKMGIYQRNLATFSEQEIITNDRTGGNCINCHTFNHGNPNEMVLHMRKINPGTLIVKEGNVTKLNTLTDHTISGFVYPYWHPAGNDIAFSTNHTQMSFFESNSKLIEVYDLLSDIVLYNLPKNEIYTSPFISDPGQMENLPLFSPDGTKLYFSTCPKVDSLPQEFDRVKYRLCSIGFDVNTRQFASSVDTLIDLTGQGKGISLPSVSPNGRFILCSVAQSGCFHSWDKESELYLYDTHTRQLRPATELNSPQSESCTTWSANSRWVVFSSRRLDGVYNRLFIAHVDEQGRLGKPFLLPQKDPRYYEHLFKAYNLPRLVTGPVDTPPDRIARTVKADSSLQVTFDPRSNRPKVPKNTESPGQVN